MSCCNSISLLKVRMMFAVQFRERIGAPSLPGGQLLQKLTFPSLASYFQACFMPLKLPAPPPPPPPPYPLPEGMHCLYRVPALSLML